MAQIILGPKNRLQKISGGINSNVYVCSKESLSCVIKEYPIMERSSHDRLQSEIEFLGFASKVTVGKVPKVIGISPEERCIAMEYIEGKKMGAGDLPTKYDIEDAVRFLEDLNTEKELARKMIHMQAKDGFVSITEHLLCLTERVEKMSVGHLSIRYRDDASKVVETIKQKLEFVSEGVQNALASEKISNLIDSNSLRVSPSDFGFHNAIKTGSGFVFIDFEFAGWDDPAKIAVDFILQPRNPVTRQLTTVMRRLTTSQQFEHKRLYIILKILLVKWHCIIMSSLDASRASQLQLAFGTSSIDDIFLIQLERLKNYELGLKTRWKRLIVAGIEENDGEENETWKRLISMGVGK